MNREEKLKTFRFMKLKHSIRYVYLNLPLEINSFKDFHLQNQSPQMVTNADGTTYVVGSNPTGPTNPFFRDRSSVW